MQHLIDTIEQQLSRSGGESRRLFHGRGHCYPGLEHLVIDWFPPVAVIRLYADVDAAWLDRLCGSLQELAAIEALVVQERGRGREARQRIVFGEVPERLPAVELGLRYWVRPLQNQNSGLFLDMREGRRWVRDNARDARVLNLFAYSCAFSVAAVAGGARSVVNLDMSRGALAQGRENHRLNEQQTADVRFLAHDLMKSWGKLRKLGPYDLILIDPPSFQPGSFVADRDYLKVLRRLPELAAPGCRILACHNDPMHDTVFVRDLVAEACPEFRLQQLLPNPDDFPERDAGRGLKVMLFEREA
ncbi:MAG: class I SAM-dependent methyltransferase [Oceanospirillaceae bacterium]|nr:class I SAM-dependent methyltransferase [Oceanospirillaceae bacterium]